MSDGPRYDRSETLDMARDAFLKQGYEAFGIRAIEERLGLNQGAVETEFGGKTGLFREVLGRYTADLQSQIFSRVAAGRLDEIGVFFTELTTPQEDGRFDHGCLMVNAVCDRPDDQIVQAQIKRHFEALLAAFNAALQRSRATGELRDDVDIEKASSFLLSIGMGIEVTIRLNGTVTAGRDQAAMACRLLDCWRK